MLDIDISHPKKKTEFQTKRWSLIGQPHMLHLRGKKSLQVLLIELALKKIKLKMDY
jgi:hypothetical protein